MIKNRVYKTFPCIYCGNEIHVDREKVMEAHGCLYCEKCDEAFGLEMVARNILDKALLEIKVYMKDVLELD